MRKSTLAALYFLLTALAFYLIARFFPEKSGDLLVAFFGAALGSFLGIGAALFIYQQQANDAKEAEQRVVRQAIVTEQRSIQQRHIDHIRWLSGILNQVIIYATDQAKEMTDFVAEMQAEPSEIHQLALIANSSIERLTRADNEATFHAYNTISPEDPEKDKHYGELLGITDFLAASVAQVLKNFQRYLESMYKRQLQIKAMLEQAANDLATLKLSMDTGGPQASHFNTPLHIRTNQLLLDYTSLIVRMRPMRELIADFVNPLLPVLLGNKHFPGANELIMQLKNINVAFTDLKRDSEDWQESFDPTKLKEPADRLAIVRGRLQNGITSAEAKLV